MQYIPNGPQDLHNICQQKGGKYIIPGSPSLCGSGLELGKREMCATGGDRSKAAAIVLGKSGWSKVMRDRCRGSGSSGLSSLFPPTPCPLSHSASSSSSHLPALLTSRNPRPTRTWTKNPDCPCLPWQSLRQCLPEAGESQFL